MSEQTGQPWWTGLPDDVEPATDTQLANVVRNGLRPGRGSRVLLPWPLMLRVLRRVAVRDDVLTERDAEIEELVSGVRQLAKWRAEWANTAGRELVRGDRLEAMLDRLAGQSDDNLARAQRAEAEVERLRGVDLPGHIRMENRVLWERAEAAEAEVARLREALAKVERLHRPTVHPNEGIDMCVVCRSESPCPTIEALASVPAVDAGEDWTPGPDAERVLDDLAERTGKPWRVDAGDREPASDPTRRLKACVEAWPGCVEGEYDPRCCRFPKSCSCTVYDPEQVTPEDLEPASEVCQHEWENEYLPDPMSAGAVVPSGGLVCPKCSATASEVQP